MAVEIQRASVSMAALSNHKKLIGTIVVGLVMLILARFWLQGAIAGMFGVWGTSIILVGVGAHLSLWLWNAYNR